MNKPPTMEQLRSFRDHVERVGDSFQEATADWIPMLFLFDRKGRLALGPIIMDGRSSKDMVPAAVARLCTEHKAVCGAVLFSIWYAVVQTDSPLAELSAEMMNRFGVSSRPDRREAVQIELYDGKDTEVWYADINRSADKPPALGEWKQQPRDVKLSGRFANLLERCIKG